MRTLWRKNGYKLFKNRNELSYNDKYLLSGFWVRKFVYFSNPHFYWIKVISMLIGTHRYRRWLRTTNVKWATAFWTIKIFIWPHFLCGGWNVNTKILCWSALNFVWVYISHIVTGVDIFKKLTLLKKVLDEWKSWARPHRVSFHMNLSK